MMTSDEALFFLITPKEGPLERGREGPGKKGLFYLKPHKASCTLKFVSFFSRQYISDLGQHFLLADIKNQ